MKKINIGKLIPFSLTVAVFFACAGQASAQARPAQTEKFYTYADKAPVFNSSKSMEEFIRGSLRPVKLENSGKVLVRFIIDTNGNTGSHEIVRSLNPQADSEALRVCRLMKFIPGEIRDKKVPLQWVQPVAFTRPED